MMPRAPRPRVRQPLALALLLGASVACERSQPVARTDTAAPPSVLPESAAAAAPVASTWDESAGAALVVAGEDPSTGFVIFPEYASGTTLDTAHFDLARVRHMRVDLFAPGRTLGQAVLDSVRAPAPLDACTAWPTAHLALAPAGGAVPPWTVAFEATHARAIALDSVEQLASADSVRLVADVARLASALPGDTAAAFRGLPFVVRAVRRFEAAPGVRVLVADVVRKLNVEASPRQERLLIVAERDSAGGGRYTPVYTERMSGPEETVEGNDVLAVVALGSAARPTVVLGRDSGDAVAFSLIERVGPKHWRLRWSSAPAGC